MKSIIIFFLFLGILFIMKGQSQLECPPPRVEYRYIPKPFIDQQYERLPILATYGKLFSHASPWEKSIGYPGTFYNKKEEF